MHQQIFFCVYLHNRFMEGAGPTAKSNWAVPQKILCGALPSAADIDVLITHGVDFFVCLQAEVPCHASAEVLSIYVHPKRNKPSVPPYFDDALRIGLCFVPANMHSEVQYCALCKVRIVQYPKAAQVG